MQDPPKFTQIWIFGLKTNHLATLAPTHISSHCGFAPRNFLGGNGADLLNNQRLR
jgi:hypothetical protein